MHTPLTLPKPRPIVYPESDGQPMAENTRQFRYIVTIKEGLEYQYRDDPNVFVAGDLFWYPVEGEPSICQAPDVLAARGRPKGDRGSYKQWEEGGLAPQVVFEILSPGNRHGELIRKFQFYERYGVAEYYVYDPDRGTLEGWLRQGNQLREIPNMEGWVSPQLGIRFTLVNGELVLYRPDGQRFLTPLELATLQEQTRRQAEEAQRLAAQEKQAKEQAEQVAEQEKQAREQAEQVAERRAQEVQRLREQLRALGINPDLDNPGPATDKPGPAASG